MEGYTRNSDTIIDLRDAVSDALDTYPEQRLTQIILNATRRDGVSTLDTSQLWSLHDETLIEALNDYVNRRADP